MKVLILGHGWRLWNERSIPRCAPMSLYDWKILVQDAPKENLLFLDFSKVEEPDIWENVANPWSQYIALPHSYDFVIDAISHLATTYRKSKHYWEGVKYSLKDDGIYIGWNDHPHTHNIDRFVRLKQSELDSHIALTYDTLITPKKRYQVI